MLKSKNFLFLICISICVLCTKAQSTTGLVYKTENTSNGYVLITAKMAHKAYLIDECGFVINFWNLIDRPNESAYLKKDGSIIYAIPNGLIRQSWDGNIEQEFRYTHIDNYQVKNHHDIEPMENGNVLMIITKKYSFQELTINGRDPSIALNHENYIDGIIEVEFDDNNVGAIVWQWDAMDHIIQDFNPLAQNYGSVSENFRKLDFNYFVSDDFMHMNSIDYNEETDEILFSCRSSCEIYIIDHSTTTQEAATSSGGNAGFGGDFLWRWGNPAAYQKENDQILFGQHDANFYNDTETNETKISVFNNGYWRAGNYSTLEFLSFQRNADASFAISNSGTFLPQTTDLSHSGLVLNDSISGPFESGVQVLSNGNLFVSELLGKFYELDKNTFKPNWIYYNPILNDATTIQQGDFEDTHIFKAFKYNVDYLNFEVESTDSLIENENENSEFCKNKLQIIFNEEILVINPIKNFIIFNPEYNNLPYSIFDLNGKTISTSNTSESNNLSNFSPGIYILKIEQEEEVLFQKIILQH